MKMWKIAGFPIREGTDTLGLVIEGAYQIRSRQVWERGLKGGETEGNADCRTGAPIVTKGAAEGTEPAADCAVYSDGRLEFRVSLIDP